MNVNRIVCTLCVAGAAFLTSCEPMRVNERPLGLYPPTINSFGEMPQAPELTDNPLLNDVRGDQNGLAPLGGGSAFNPDPANTNSGTLGNILRPNVVQAPTTPTTPGIGNTGITSPIPTPTPQAPIGNEIPYATPTNDPLVVISPYGNKVKILNRKTNQPFPSGKIMRDPKAMKTFRVP